MCHLGVGPTILSFFGFFTFGLITSLHCVGMCGPLSVILCREDGKRRFSRTLAFYHASRIVSYAVVGLFLGFVGSAIQIAWLQVIVGWVAVGFLLVYILGVHLPMPRWVLGLQQYALRTVPVNRPSSRALLLGFFSPLLPCGLLYAAFAACLMATTAWIGGVWMLAFALGTVPLLVFGQWGVCAAGDFLSPHYQKLLFRGLALFGVGFILYMRFAMI